MSQGSPQPITQDRASRVLDLSRVFPVDADLIDRNLDEAEDIVRRKGPKFDYREFTKSSPIMARWLSDSPYHVAVLGDDVGSWVNLEEKYRRRDDPTRPETPEETRASGEMRRKIVEEKLATYDVEGAAMLKDITAKAEAEILSRGAEEAAKYDAADPELKAAMLRQTFYGERFAQFNVGDEERSRVHRSVAEAIESKYRAEQTFATARGPETARDTVVPTTADLPFVGGLVGIGDDWDIVEAQKAKGAGKQLTAYQEYILDRRAWMDLVTASRGRTTGFYITGGIKGVGTFGVELALTLGLSAGVEGAVQVSRLMRWFTQAERGVVTAARSKAAKFAAGTAGAAALTPLSAGSRIIDNFVSRQTRDMGLTEDEAGKLRAVLQPSDSDGVLVDAIKAYLGEFIERGTETVGGDIIKMLLPALRTRVLGRWLKEAPVVSPAVVAAGHGVRQRLGLVLKKGAALTFLHGPVEESLEEDMAAILRGVTGVDEYHIPTQEELIIRAGVLAAPFGLGAAIYGAGYAADKAILYRAGRPVSKPLENAQMIKGMIEMVQAQTSTQKAPEVARNLAEKITEKSVQYLDRKTAEVFYQKEGLDPAAEIGRLTGDPQAWERGREAQTPIPISLAAVIVGTKPEHMDFFQKNLRETPDASSLQETIDAVQEEAGRPQEAAAATPEEREAVKSMAEAGAQRIHDLVLAQGVAAGRSQTEAKAVAVLEQRRWRQLGIREGKDPWALFQSQGQVSIERGKRARVRALIAKPAAPAAAGAPAVASEFKTAMRALRRGEAPAAGKTLSQWVRAYGSIGITRKGAGSGEVAQLLGGKSRAGLSGLIKKNGKKIDDVAAAAAAAGYFPHAQATGGETAPNFINYLLDALDDEARGQKHYSDQAGAAPAAVEKHALGQDLQQELDRLHINPWGMTDEQVQAAMEEAYKKIDEAGQAEERFFQLDQPPIPPTFSQLQRTIEAKMPTSASVEQVRGIIKDQKADEVKWSGIDEFLKGKTKVDKAELLAFLRGNELQVKVVTLGGSQLSSAEELRLETLRDRIARRGRVGIDTLTPAEREEYDRLSSAQQEPSATKFSSYQLPGGTNYREVVFALPVPGVDTAGWTATILRDISPVTGKPEFDVRDSTGTHIDTVRTATTSDEAVAIAGRGTQRSTAFRAGHFDTPNVIAHVRVNDRVDADGKRVLFVEEVQSDWHQKGRERGYKSDDESARRQELEAISEQRDYTPEEQADWDRIADAGGHRPGSAAVPDAPFRKSWHEFVMKRVIRMAAEGGYDRVAWTTGEQQALRYKEALLKEIKSIEVAGRTDAVTGERTRTILMDTTSGHTLQLGVGNDGVVDNAIGLPGAEKKPLSDVVGKDLAKKLMESEPGTKLAGEGLAVGGEGMKGFYDKIIPQWVNKFAKKWGGKVGETQIPTDPLGGKEERIIESELGTALLFAGFGDEGVKRISDTWGSGGREEAMRAAPAAVREYEQAHATGTLATVHSLDLTPALKTAALEQGFSMFARDVEGVSLGETFFASNSAGPTAVNIILKKGANKSTLTHELSHLFYRTMETLVLSGSASAETTKQFRVMREWVGAEEGAKLTTKQHELLARGWEQYLMDGRAPSHELRGVFRKFRKWLSQIYDVLKGVHDLDIQLTQEVRDVLDHILATDQEIEAVQESEAMRPLWPEPETMGLAPGPAKRYREAVAAAIDATEEKVIPGAMRSTKARGTKEWDARKAVIKAEVAKDYDSDRDNIARAHLEKGTQPDGSPLPQGMEPFKLSRQAIEAMPEGAEWLRQLPPVLLTDTAGVHPDIAAQVLDYNSGEDLMTAMAATNDRDMELDDIADAVLREERGDPMTVGALNKTVVDAMYTEQRATVLRLEAEHIMSNDPATWRKIVQPFTSGTIPTAESLAETVRKTIGVVDIRNLRPDFYQKTEQRFARAAARMAILGRLQDALEAKRAQIINHELYRAARDAKERAEANRKYLDRFNDDEVRAEIGKSGHDYLEQIDGLMERLDLRTMVSEKTVAKRQALLVWVEEQRALGHDVPVPADVLDEAGLTSYLDLTPTEFNDAANTVRAIAHIAGLKNKLLAAEKGRTFSDTKAAMIESMVKHHGPVKAKPPVHAPGLADMFGERIKGIIASHTKMEFLFEYLDGVKALGANSRAFFRPVAEAEEAEAEQMQGVIKNLDSIFGAYSKAERAGWFLRRDIVPGIPVRLNKANKLVIALNWGNEYNREALMRGEGWTQSQVQAILDTLDERDWKTVVAIWRYLDSFRPAVGALERDVNGLEPEWVEGIPVITKFGTVQGGYYPIVFDAKASFRQAQIQETERVQEMFGGNWAYAMTRHGHTIARRGTGGKPLRLQLSGLTNHLTAVVHDLTHRKVVMDLNKLMHDEDIQGAIASAAGNEMLPQIRNWMLALAGGWRLESTNDIERLASQARNGATIVNLGLKFTSATLQILGYLNTVDEIGPVASVDGLMDVYANPFKIADNWRFVMENSKMMAGRIKTWDRDVRDARRRLAIGSARPGILVAKDIYLGEVENAYMAMIGYMDLAVSVPSWSGAYRQAMDGKTENVTKGHHKDAVAYADGVVRKTQSAGAPKDLANIQRGSESFKLFTMFYSSMAILFNRFNRAYRKVALDKNFIRFAGSVLLMSVVPAVLEEALRGRLPKGDDDEKKMKWLLRKQILYPFQTIVGLRDLSHGFDRYMQWGQVDVEGSPAFAAAEAAVLSAAAIVHAIDTDTDVKKREWRGMVDTVGYTAGLPTRQTWQTIEYFYDWMEGVEAPSNIAEGVYRGLVIGAPAK